MSIVLASIYYAPGQWWDRRSFASLILSGCLFGDVEEAFEEPIHHRIDVPRLESFIHYQMTQAAIVFHRACV